MTAIAVPRRPALLPALALLCGAASALLPHGGHGQPVVLACGAALVLLPLRRDRVARTIGCLSLLFVGAALAEQDRSRRARRLDALFGAERAVELHLVGRLVAAPEPTFDGGWCLRLRGRREALRGEAGQPVTVELRLGPSVLDATPDRFWISGARVRVWCRLRRPRALGNPASGDAELALAARGLDAVGWVKSPALVELLDPPARDPRAAVDRVKLAARRRLDAVFGTEGERRALAAALLLGERRGLDAERVRLLREAGLAHLVAISGLHVGVLVLLLLGLMRAAPLSLRLPPLLLFLAGFAHAVGARSSIVRAALGAAAAHGGRLIGREGDPLNGLACIAAGLVAASPATLADPGFQLTFLATGGIVIGARRLAERLPLPRALALVAAVSLAAFLATAPAAAWWFRRLTPVCLLTNLVAAPLCALVLLSGYAALLACGLPLVGAACAAPARLAIDALLALSELGASFEAGSSAVARPSAWLLLVHYGAAWRLGVVGRGGRGTGLLLTACLLGLHLGPPPSRPARGPEASVLDVGQGQAIVVRAGNGEVIVVDAAGRARSRFDPGERIVLPWLVDAGLRRIDVLVVSHEHVDHAGGAFALLRDAEVGQLWLPVGFAASPILARLAALARERGTAVVLAERGASTVRGGLALRILAPPRGAAGLAANDRSVVVLLGREPCRLLLPADLGREGERALVIADLPLRAEALVVTHHGSRFGSSPAFLARVRPRIALVSCGHGNRFGHPHPSVVRRLADGGAALWRTDLDGMLALRCGAQGWSVAATRRGRSAEPE